MHQLLDAVILQRTKLLWCGVTIVGRTYVPGIRPDDSALLMSSLKEKRYCINDLSPPHHILTKKECSFIELAGGLVDGSDPPAFQRAEKREWKEQLEKKTKEEDLGA
ncbi:Uncharacterized protein Rs2_22124 [Raphanus sativus]|nr:Uncharacterized protein Rs2_22124 [Raphanus sativus]